MRAERKLESNLIEVLVGYPFEPTCFIDHINFEI